MLVRSFDDDEEPADEGAAAETGAPEYVFEGFTIEVSDKVMLTPADAAANARVQGRPS